MLFITPSESIAVITLEPHLQSWQWLPRGTQLVLEKGCIRFTQQVYLAEVCLSIPRVLNAGQADTLVQSGWVQLQALDGTGAHLIVVKQGSHRLFWHGFFNRMLPSARRFFGLG